MSAAASAAAPAAAGVNSTYDVLDEVRALVSPVIVSLTQAFADARPAPAPDAAAAAGGKKGKKGGKKGSGKPASLEDTVARVLRRAKSATGGQLSLPVQALGVALARPDLDLTELTTAIAAGLNADPALSAVVQQAEAAEAFLTVHLTPAFLGTIIPRILAPADKGESFLSPRPLQNDEKVMIEYSQPNTHKSFHVGHMRNVALGDAFVRIYEQMGFPVIAANYFGDEGAHVAKTLWLLENRYSRAQLDAIPEDTRAEFLGDVYIEATELLDLKSMTSLPHLDVLAARVVSKAPHPNADAPKNWHVVQLDVGADAEVTVVCGGTEYEVGQFVAYMPVGGAVGGKEVVHADKMGVTSSGVMLAATELGLKMPGAPKVDEAAAAAAAAAAAPAAASAGKKSKKGKSKGGKSKAAAKDSRILLLSAEDYPALAAGAELVELGRTKVVPVSEADTDAAGSVSAVYRARTAAVGGVLRRIETLDPEMIKLWKETRQWSIDAFKRVYAWLGARFDHDFSESECSEDAQKIVGTYLDKGLFKLHNGCVGVDLGKKGFCMVRKTDGNTLYATKDLALARRKFDQFAVQRSIYVVDISQERHFEQVFATLKLMGFAQADKCVHLKYGMVTLPGAGDSKQTKMSTRTGRVIPFTELKQSLHDYLEKEFFADKITADGWTADEVEDTLRAVSVAAIRHGMLKHLPTHDVVFKLEDWASISGNTGPYLLYQYTRVASIRTKANLSPEELAVESDFSVLTLPKESEILWKLSLFWDVLDRTLQEHNPNQLCAFLFEIAQLFSSWYSMPEANIKNTEDPVAKKTRLDMANAVAATLETGLGLLGIPVVKKM